MYSVLSFLTCAVLIISLCSVLSCHKIVCMSQFVWIRLDFDLFIFLSIFRAVLWKVSGISIFMQIYLILRWIWKISGIMMSISLSSTFLVVLYPWCSHFSPWEEAGWNELRKWLELFFLYGNVPYFQEIKRVHFYGNPSIKCGLCVELHFIYAVNMTLKHGIILNQKYFNCACIKIMGWIIGNRFSFKWDIKGN